MNVADKHKTTVLETIISLFLEDLQQLRVTWRQAQKSEHAAQIIEDSLSIIEPIDLQHKVRSIWAVSLQNQ